MINIEDIKDDELRVLGKHGSVAPSKKKGLRWYHVALIAAAVVAVVLAVCFIAIPSGKDAPAEDFYESTLPEPAPETDAPVQDAIGDSADTAKAHTEYLTRTINDIPLDIYIPHNAKPKLLLGVPSLDDESIIFATQAADIRADNGKINGAYVLAGEPLSWGLSKMGYCGIIDGKVTVGVAKDSPLFEKATETGGYFFRQYALVDNGKLVENEPKGKSYRKAICDRNGEIMIVMSSTKESYHDFSQALVDFGVNNAVYLVGSVSHGYYRNSDSELCLIYERHPGYQPNENYIIWVND